MGTPDQSREAVQPMEFGDFYLEEYLSDPAYLYVEIDDGENWYEKLKRKINQAINRFFSWLIGEGKLGRFGEFLIQALPYLAILILSILLLWVVTKYEVYPTADKKTGAHTGNFPNDEEIIKRQDIQTLIDEAIANEDFRLAVRYSYLSVLKKMMDRSLIDWKIQKTNHDYIKELPEGTLRMGFVSITKAYDYIWYGGFEIDQAGFESIRKGFIKVEGQL